jgi:ubiquitin-like-conjugating enzyme ATG10
VAGQGHCEEAWGPEDGEEEDAEALPKLPRKRELELHYHIVYSVSYQVPVLYFTPATPLGVEETVALVSEGYPHGAVTQQEHPLNGEIWWFVHPCHTAEFMREFQGRLGEGGYLAPWLGVVGAALAEVGSVKDKEA